VDQLDYSTTLRLVNEIIAEHGEDYVYEAPGPSCMYVSDGRPSCIVGHVLTRHGVDITSWEDENTNTGDIANLIDEGAVSASDDAHVFLMVLQRLQDQGHPWGHARDVAAWAVEDPTR
jgi:hypothetical protein